MKSGSTTWSTIQPFKGLSYTGITAAIFISAIKLCSLLKSLKNSVRLKSFL